MVQGTTSGVGESVVTAGLCRLRRRRGFRVTPFKAQNMELNAAVRRDGEEIALDRRAGGHGRDRTKGRHVLDPAEAGGRGALPGHRLRARVGRGARAYFARKHNFWPVVADALDRLRNAHEVVVTERAGSPAELNLRDRDILNMRVARCASAAVRLVGAIDCGAVSAQLVGTVELLSPAERARVRGLVVNRFRGDRTLVRVFRQADFSRARDGEALLRRHKASYFAAAGAVVAASCGTTTSPTSKSSP